MLSNAQDLSAVPLQMQFDPKVLALVNVDAGELLGAMDRRLRWCIATRATGW